MHDRESNQSLKQGTVEPEETRSLSTSTSAAPPMMPFFVPAIFMLEFQPLQYVQSLPFGLLTFELETLDSFTVRLLLTVPSFSTLRKAKLFLAEAFDKLCFAAAHW